MKPIGSFSSFKGGQGGYYGGGLQGADLSGGLGGAAPLGAAFPIDASAGAYAGPGGNAGLSTDPGTGMFQKGGNQEAGLNNGFYWSGGYWGYCPPPPTVAPAPAPPPNNLQLTAVIKDPKNGAEIPTGPMGTANVVFDGSLSTPGPGKRIVSWSWLVLLLPDRTPAASGLGPVVQKTLAPGQYLVTLAVGAAVGWRGCATQCMF